MCVCVEAGPVLCGGLWVKEQVRNWEGERGEAGRGWEAAGWGKLREMEAEEGPGDVCVCVCVCVCV